MDFGPPKDAPAPHAADGSPSSDAPWPGNTPDTVTALAALAAGLSNALPAGSPLATITGQVLVSLSDLERAILSGGSHPIEAGPLRRAAAMRLRVAAALATVPPPGVATDTAAVGAILGEIDAILSDVSALAAAAPAELQPQLGAVRNALVKEAIDFSEVAQRVGQADVVPAAAPRASAKAAQTRLLTVDKRDAPPRTVWRWILLGAALLAFAGFHGSRQLERQQAMARVKTIAGAPEGMMLLSEGRAGVRLLVPYGSKVPDHAQLEKFIEQQRAEGFEVLEMVGGGLELRRPAPQRQGGPP